MEYEQFRRVLARGAGSGRPTIALYRLRAILEHALASGQALKEN